MEKVKDLFEKVFRPPARQGAITTVNPTLNKLASQLEAKNTSSGNASKPLEELLKASHEKHLLESISEQEAVAVAQGPEIMKQQELHHDDESKEAALVKKLTKKVSKHTVKDRELAAKHNACQSTAKKKALKSATKKLKKADRRYDAACKEEGLKPTGKKLAKASGLLFYMGAVAIFGVEAAANFQAYLKVYSDDILSTAVLALGASLGVTIMGKICGAVLFSFKSAKSRKLIPIAVFVVALIATIAFSLVVGGTRAFGDLSQPAASKWSEIGALVVNVFLLLCMIASTWAYHTKKALAETINPLLENKLNQEKLVSTLLKEIDALRLAKVEKDISIEADHRSNLEEAKNHIRNQGLEVAKRVGSYHAVLSSIKRKSHIVSAALGEAIWGIRIHSQLSRKPNEANRNVALKPEAILDAKLYQVPDSPFSKSPEKSSSENSSINVD